MKKRLVELIVCPHGLPYEYPLVADIIRESAGDIETGTLNTLTEDDRRGAGLRVPPPAEASCAG